MDEIKDVIMNMAQLAQQEGEHFKKINGRYPNKEEAERIADMILRQARTALSMVRQ